MTNFFSEVNIHKVNITLKMLMLTLLKMNKLVCFSNRGNDVLLGFHHERTYVFFIVLVLLLVLVIAIEATAVTT